MHYIALLSKFIIIYWQPFFLTLSILLTIYILNWPLSYRVRDVKITLFTYIGALIYISFYILFFIGLRWVQINKEIDIKKIPNLMENFLYIYNKSFFNQIFYTLLIILLVLLWVYIFIKLREKLSYQVWKVYFYYRYKYLLTAWQDKKYSSREEKIIKIFKKYFSYHELCNNISHNFIILCKKSRFLTVAKWLNNLKHMQNLIRFLIIFLIFVFLFYDCYFNDFVLSSIKYYLFFYMIFSLWYKISKFFREEASFIDKIIFEITYCAPNVIYINLTEEEYKFLDEHLKNPKVGEELLEFLSTFIWATPPVAYYKRFVYTEVHDILDISENGYNRIPYNYVYKNKKTQRYFPPEWLKEKDGKYYTDQEL